MQELNEKQIRAIHGGAVPMIVVAPIAGAFWNGYQYFAGSHDKTFGGALLALGSGAVAGVVAVAVPGAGGVFYGAGLGAVGGMAAPLVGNTGGSGAGKKRDTDENMKQF